MEWSTKPPVAPGFYWARLANEVHKPIVVICEILSHGYQVWAHGEVFGLSYPGSDEYIEYLAGDLSVDGGATHFMGPLPAPDMP